MIFGASNMSWSIEEAGVISKKLKQYGFEYVESVYSKLSEDFPVKAIQSIFYGSKITSLDDTDKCVSHVKKIIDDCESRSISVITFGSPTMRIGEKNKMHDFLKEIDMLLKNSNINFCIEPNASFYGAEYYNKVSDICLDLNKFDNICTMIDVGNSILEGQNVLEEYKKYKDKVSHVHFAAPGLKSIQDFNIYKEFKDLLLENNYSGMISYEFASTDDIDKTLSDFSREIIGV